MSRSIDGALASRLRGMPLALAAECLTELAALTPDQRKAGGLAAMCSICPPRSAETLRAYARAEGYSEAEADAIASAEFPHDDGCAAMLAALQSFKLPD